MNQTNLDYLKNGLRSMGFGEKLNESLEASIYQQSPQFQLRLDGQFGKENVQYVLDFKKSEQSDRYFFNQYRATLKAEDPANEKSQTFYVHKNTGITAKEAYNLLEGRAVNKTLSTADGQPYNAWVQLDFNEKDQRNNYKVKQFGERYGYDLGKSLSKLPIRELNGPEQKEKLLKSLQKGNLQEVTFEKEGTQEKRFIEASPQFKSVNVYTEEMKKIFVENTKKESQSMKGQSIRQPGNQPDSKESTAMGKDASRRKGMSM